VEIDIKKIAEDMIMREKFAGLTVEPPFIVRIDIRNARAICKTYFQKENKLDWGFHNMLIKIAEKIVGEVEPWLDIAYTGSDEISFICLSKAPPFSGRIEKLNSVLASEAASLLTSFFIEKGIKTGIPLSFDSRVIKADNIDDVVNYLTLRKVDCFRNTINWYSETLMSPKQLQGMKMIERLKIIEDAGIRIDKWARYGTVVYKVPVKKEVTDKKTGEQVIVERKKIATQTGDELLYVLNKIRAGE